MKKETITIILGSICTILVLGAALFIMYKKDENKLHTDTTNKPIQNESKPMNNTEDNTDNSKTSNEESNNKAPNNEPVTNINTPEENKTPTTNAEEKQVTMYIFHGSTCPACQNALKNIKEKKNTSYKNVIVKTFEIWGNQDNSNLMQKVADKLNVEAKYIPFIIIGNYSTTGYDEDMLLSEIKKAQDNKNYQDIVTQVINENKELNTHFETIKNN